MAKVMKKKLEAELISIAHRVLKLKGKEDVIQMHQETQKLLEKLAVLRFYEEHIATIGEEVPESVLENFLEQTEKPVKEEPVSEEKPEEKKKDDKTETSVKNQESNAGTENLPLPEETKESKEEKKEEPVENGDISFSFELSEEEEAAEENPEEDTVTATSQQVSLEDFLSQDYSEPEFVKVNDVPKETVQSSEISFERKEEIKSSEEKIQTTTTEIITQKTEQRTLSLNDRLNKGINIGLNDRIAFVKHLFGGSNEDYNRVLSQLNTIDSHEEAISFIENLVKPDYNQWEGKEEYADRFLAIVEKKFA